MAPIFFNIPASVVRPLALTGLPLYPILLVHNALGPYGLANDNML